MHIPAHNVDEYLAQLPKERMEVIEKIRGLIHKHLPAVKETMQYKMPTFELDGESIFAIASQKQYISFYVMDVLLLNQFRDDFRSFNVGKSCVRIKKVTETPYETIEKMIKNDR